MAKEDAYKESRVIAFPQGTVTVHIPDLTDDERERRMKNIAHAAALLLYPELKGQSFKVERRKGT